MATIIYRCPTTGLNVQGWFADDPARADADDTYESLICTACTKLHLINPKTGRTLGDDRQ
ncbi:MAG: hypothetical protein ABSF87_03225 [Xanthobacteraceae bacterium]|jgi:hypothetical protein